jgi:cobalamin biosynthesis protein CobT
MDKYLAATPLVERELAPQIADQLQHAPLPDAGSYESTVFHQVADARLAISEASEPEEVDRIYFAVARQLEHLQAEIPQELTQARHERLAALTQ